MAAYVDESELDESALEQELGLLQAIYIHELDIQSDESGHPAVLSLTLHPSTADNVDLQYVCLTLVFTLTPEYPDVLPDIAIKNPRGISDEQLTSLSKQLHQLAREQKGSAMLYELIEVAKEALTHNNTPYGQCVICLEDFKEGEAFTKTACYHHFHCDCLARYIQHALDNPEDKEDKPDNKEGGKEKETKNEVVCAVCREPITYDLEQLKSTPRRQTANVHYRPDIDMLALQKKMAALFKLQKEKGGIIDVEAESNRFLIDISVTPTLPMSTVIGSTDEKLKRSRTTASSEPMEDDQQSDKSKDRRSQTRNYHTEKKQEDDDGRRKGSSYYRQNGDKRENRGRGSSRPSSGRYGDRQYYRSDRRNWRDDDKRPLQNGENRRDIKSSGADRNIERQGIKSSDKSESNTGRSSENHEKESRVESASSEVKSGSIENGDLVQDDHESLEEQRRKEKKTDHHRRYDRRDNRRERNYDRRDNTIASNTNEQNDRKETNGRPERDRKVLPEQRDDASSNDKSSRYPRNINRPSSSSKDKSADDVPIQDGRESHEEQRRKQNETDRPKRYDRRDNWRERNYDRRDNTRASNTKDQGSRKEKGNSREERDKKVLPERRDDASGRERISQNPRYGDRPGSSSKDGKPGDVPEQHQRQTRKFDQRHDRDRYVDRPGSSSKDGKPGDVPEQNQRQTRKTDQRQDRNYNHPRREYINPRDRQRSDRRRDFDDKSERRSDKGLADTGKRNFRKKEWENETSSRQDNGKVSDCKAGSSLRPSSQESSSSIKDEGRAGSKEGRQNPRNRRNYQQRNRTDLERDKPQYEQDLGRNRNTRGKEANNSSDKASSEKHQEDQVNHNHTPSSKSELSSNTSNDVSTISDCQTTKDVTKSRPPPGFEQPPTIAKSTLVKPPPGFEDFR